MRDFQILFDHGERSELLDPVYAPYGKLGFPAVPAERPWVYANFVQTLDGVVSLLGANASGSDIAQSAEDRWLMDLLRAHADAVLIGMGTLRVETELGRPSSRGPVFRIVDHALQELRKKLHRGQERNIVVTASTDIQFDNYAVFDGKKVDAILLTTADAASKLAPQLRERPQIKVVICGNGTMVDLPAAMHILRTELNIRYLLCEGGPVLYSNMLAGGLIDEKFLTVSPIEVGQRVPQSELENLDNAAVPFRPSVLAREGFSKEDAIKWEWLSCRKVGDHQFHRFRLRKDQR